MGKFGIKKDCTLSLEEATLQIQKLTKEIAKDGQITSLEIDTLLNWLNKNKNFESQWPFKNLYKFLFDAFEDGIFSDEEKNGLMSLIEEIQTVPIVKEPSLEDSEKKQQSQSWSNALFGKIVTLFVPGSGQTIIVKSYSDSSQEYRVDVDEKTCTCPDFISNRRNFAKTNLKRFCKHIILGLTKTGKLEQFSEPIKAFLKERCEGERGVNWNETHSKTMIEKSEVFLTKSETSPWVNVYAPYSKAKKYRRFGFTLEEGRWSYGSKPLNAKEVENWIFKLW